MSRMRALILISAAVLAICACVGNDPARPVNAQAAESPGVVSWVHLGDLHTTTGDQQDYADLQTLIRHVNESLAGSVNFAYLPGDNANDSTESQYQLIKQATDKLRVPLYAVPGDHDLKSGSLALFQKYMEAPPWRSFSTGPYHFIFLNALDASPRGGFGLSDAQIAWLKDDLKAATQANLQSVVFLHCFPSGLGNSTQTLLDLIQQHHIPMVEVGHTHYNAVANDGHTIYAATRSTGQISEGPVGFSITNLDRGVVSWKFKPLGGWPFVMITSPADKLFMTDPTQPQQVVRGVIEVRAKIWGAGQNASVTYAIDGQKPQPLARIGATTMWGSRWDSARAADGDHEVVVQVRDASGNASEDKISFVVNQAGTYRTAPKAPGDQGNSIGVYSYKGLLGTAGKAKAKKAGAAPKDQVAQIRDRLAKANTTDPAGKTLEADASEYLSRAEQLLLKQETRSASEFVAAADALSHAIDHLGHAEDPSKTDFPGREEQFQRLEKVAARVQQIQLLQKQSKDPTVKRLAQLAAEFSQHARQAYDRADARHADEYTKVADEIGKCLEHVAAAAASAR